MIMLHIYLQEWEITSKMYSAMKKNVGIWVWWLPLIFSQIPNYNIMIDSLSKWKDKSGTKWFNSFFVQRTKFPFQTIEKKRNTQNKFCSTDGTKIQSEISPTFSWT